MVASYSELVNLIVVVFRLIKKERKPHTNQSVHVCTQAKKGIGGAKSCFTGPVSQRSRHFGELWWKDEMFIDNIYIPTTKVSQIKAYTSVHKPKIPNLVIKVSFSPNQVSKANPLLYLKHSNMEPQT